MEKFVIEGGRPLEGEMAISGAKNSALPALAASLLTSEPVTLRRIPGVRDIHTMVDLLRHTGAEVDAGEDGVYRIAAGRSGQRRGSLRDREDDASFESGAGSAAGAHRPGARFPARWLRDRHPAHQSAYRRAGTARRPHRAVPRLHRGRCSRRASRCADPFRSHHGHRHRGPAHGGRAGRRGDGARQRRPRARGGRPCRPARQNGRAHRGRRHVAHPHSGRRAARRRRSQHHRRPHRGRHVPGGGGNHRRRLDRKGLRPGSCRRAARQAAQGRREHRRGRAPTPSACAPAASSAPSTSRRKNIPASPPTSRRSSWRS